MVKPNTASVSYVQHRRSLIAGPVSKSAMFQTTIQSKEAHLNPAHSMPGLNNMDANILNIMRNFREI